MRGENVILHKQYITFKWTTPLSHFLNLLNRPSSNLNLQVAIAKSFWKPMASLFASQTCNSSRQKCPKTSFRKRCLSMVKQQKTRFYILGRCISMLLCWHAHSLADWMARLCVLATTIKSFNQQAGLQLEGCNYIKILISAADRRLLHRSGGNSRWVIINWALPFLAIQFTQLYGWINVVILICKHMWDEKEKPRRWRWRWRCRWRWKRRWIGSNPCWWKLSKELVMRQLASSDGLVVYKFCTMYQRF